MAAWRAQIGAIIPLYNEGAVDQRAGREISILRIEGGAIPSNTVISGASRDCGRGKSCEALCEYPGESAHREHQQSDGRVLTPSSPRPASPKDDSRWLTSSRFACFLPELVNGSVALHVVGIVETNPELRGTLPVQRLPAILEEALDLRAECLVIEVAAFVDRLKSVDEGLHGAPLALVKRSHRRL